MKKTVLVDQSEVANTLEQTIAGFIIDNVDKKHFRTECFIEDEETLNFDLYDRERINKKLRKMDKKELKQVVAMGYGLYLTVEALEVQLHRSAFTFVAYLKDLQLKIKTL